MPEKQIEALIQEEYDNLPTLLCKSTVGVTKMIASM